MKFARLRFEFPDEPLSPVQAALADCPGFEVAQLRFGGVAASGPRTYVLSVRGDLAAVADALAAQSGVLDHELVYRDGDRGPARDSSTSARSPARPNSRCAGRSPGTVS